MKSRIDRIYETLERHCDMSKYWNDPGFHCFRQFPPMVRVWPVTQAIESQLSNGGLGQLLWNSFPNWRTLVEEGIRAYAWLGAGTEAQAVKDFSSDLERHEAACRPYWERAVAEGDFSKFGEWMAVSRPLFAGVDTDAFDDLDRLSAIKEKALEQNLHEVLRAIRTNKSPGEAGVDG